MRNSICQKGMDWAQHLILWTLRTLTKDLNVANLGICG